MNLPLFPLNTLLYPGCMLDLQIFEPRYLDMVARCMKAGEGFGVVRIVEGLEVGPAASAFAAIGCEALIRDWEQRPNGLLGIRVEGGRRFSVMESGVQPDQLTLAEVDWLPEPENPSLGEDYPDLVALLEALGEHPMVEALGMRGAASGLSDLAYRLAYLLPFKPEQKLLLLQTDLAEARLALIQELLEQMQDGAPVD
ncbi:LON peptidase substrate-binding domain-containing protein [Stutzerimonas tarimensis]|uniref:LON peptidase substrate-binding domain-containing protein n=1 Tax=Stutzerimonas tarimensis TaxID=1507735 RepID=A0ABV7T635_9GAMM